MQFGIIYKIHTLRFKCIFISYWFSFYIIEAIGLYEPRQGYKLVLVAILLQRNGNET